jgi:hypothetical protein
MLRDHYREATGCACSPRPGFPLFDAVDHDVPWFRPLRPSRFVRPSTGLIASAEKEQQDAKTNHGHPLVSVCRGRRFSENKKADVVEHPQVLDHVGLLTDGPPRHIRVALHLVIRRLPSPGYLQRKPLATLVIVSPADPRRQSGCRLDAPSRRRSEISNHFPDPPKNDRILKKWFSVSPSRILDPLGVAPKAKKNRHSAIHLIQQFLLGQSTHLLNQLLDLSSVVLVQVLLINVRRRWISHCLDIDHIEVSISRNQLGGTSITE